MLSKPALKSIRLPAMCVAAILLLVACDRSTPPTAQPAADQPTANQSTANPSTADQPTKAMCPLCKGHEIDVTASTPRAEYEGTTYYFCSDGCRDTFQDNPAKYAARVPTTRPAVIVDHLHP